MFKNIYKIKYLLIAGTIALGMTSCEDLYEPEPQDGYFDAEATWGSPIIAEGVLLGAYSGLPGNYNTGDGNRAVLSGEASTNNTSSFNVNLVKGQWNSRYTISYYANAYSWVLQLNDFLNNVEKVTWDDSPNSALNGLYIKKLKSEAFGLRAYYYSELLKYNGGVGTNGELLGVPIVKTRLSDVEASKLPRDLYADCVKFILNDCDSALKYLPNRWADQDIPSELEPAKKDSLIGVNRVIGARNNNRINGLGVMAIRSDVLTRAASPSFSASGYTWQEAADATAELLVANDELAELSSSDVEFWLKPAASLPDDAETLWYKSIQTGNNREKNLLPPSLYGNGVLTPSQDFVDKFGDSNGYPIDHQSTIYLSSDPYVNRDPRLSDLVLYNGSYFSGKPIDIREGSGLDAIGNNPQSTATGYYLKKFLNPSVSLDPLSPNNGQMYYTYFRYTKALLNFAEATNEIGGPDHTVTGTTVTPRQIINAIRTRAGILNTSYVDGISGTTDFRQLIHNERAIELAFEEEYFFDILRWDEVASLNKNVKGMLITGGGSYTPFNLYEMSYKDYQKYLPIPYSEIMIYDLIQNEGWTN